MISQNKFIYIRLSNEWLLIPAVQVQEVGEVFRITKVLGSPSWFLGLALSKGRILPVFDLRDLLFPNRKRKDAFFPFQVIVSQYKEEFFGIFIETTQGLISAIPYHVSEKLFLRILTFNGLQGIAKVQDIPRAIIDILFIYNQLSDCVRKNQG